MNFVRWGNLNKVSHKKAFKQEGYHKPPLKKGIYVFHPKFIELFLVAWKFEQSDLKRHSFEYEGKIWTHLFHHHPEITYYRQSKEWYETDTKCLEKLFSLEVKERSKEINKDKIMASKWLKHAWKYMCMDSFELFIEGKVK